MLGGGIFGLVEPKDEGSSTIASCVNNNVVVSGYQNVGGLVGKVNGKVQLTGNISKTSGDLTFSIPEGESDYKLNPSSGDASSTGKVVGVVNVGGAVGYATGNTTISNLYSNASVYGNAGVGGLVGSAYNEIKKDEENLKTLTCRRQRKFLRCRLLVF